MNWEQCVQLVLQQGNKLFENLPKFPSVRRDLALLVDRNESYQNLEEIITQMGRNSANHLLV